MTGVSAPVLGGAVAAVTLRISGVTPEWHISSKCQYPMAVPEPTSTPRIDPSHVSQPVSPRNKINNMKKMDNIMTLSVKAILTLTFCLSAFLAAGRIAT
jgi:hypothetical protein